MAQLNYSADPNLPTNNYDLLPKGAYLSVIIASEIKATKTGSGEYLQLTLEVVDGPHRGRKIFDRLNIRNSNKVAEKIAMESLNALCMATNVMHLQDSEQLHNIPVIVDVTIEDGKNGYDAANRVKAYKAANGQAARPAASAAPAAAPATAANSTPVWKRQRAA